MRTESYGPARLDGTNRDQRLRWAMTAVPPIAVVTRACRLAGADLLDELCLTVSPLLAGGDAKRILDGGLLKPPARLELHHVLESDGYLFLRYLRQ